MGVQNTFNIDEVDQFSPIDDVALAVVGKYAKYQDHNYRLTIIKDVVFINVWADATVSLPSHYPFKYTDDDGEHTIDADATSIDVKGISSFNFVYKNK